MAIPSIFPTGTTIYNPEKCWNGYTLFHEIDKGATLIDMNGNVVRSWKDFQGFPNKMLPGGYILGSLGCRKAEYGYQDQSDLTQIDWDGNVVWSFNKKEYIEDSENEKYWLARQHHDYQREGNPVGYYVPGMECKVDGGNTLILWVIGFIPQIVIALVLASWFTDIRLKIHGKQFFKVVIYLPNLIMASAFALLFFAMFSTNGPINSILLNIGLIDNPIDFMGTVFGTRSLIGFMNFLMWFGNTTIMLMAAIMGISVEVFEAADLDGCNRFQRFFYVTLPLIRPILAYTLITSIIGGLQMFDVPQILTGGKGNPNRTSVTLIMFLNNHLKSKNYGMAGALSVYLFIVSGILCAIVYKMTNDNDPDGSKAAEKARKKAEKRKRRA